MRNIFKTVSYLVVFSGIFALLTSFSTQAETNKNQQPKLETSVKDPKQKYKSSFQRFKDRLTTGTFKVNILGQETKITTSTTCDPKKIHNLLKIKGMMSQEDRVKASCFCCVSKEFGRQESYVNAVTKCRDNSQHCPAVAPFRNENDFFDKTQLLSLNEDKSNKIKVSKVSVVEDGVGRLDNEYLRYRWNLEDFYLFTNFKPHTYKLKFLLGRGYTSPDPVKMKTSTNPYNHHYNKSKSSFFNPWPNAAPPIAAINAASGILGSLDVKKVQRPWIPQRSVTVKPLDRVQNGIRATMIGHATILIQTDSINILTDPVFFDIGLGNRADKDIKFYKRVKQPGVPFEWLPKIDYILLSHNHMDHFDVASLKKLESMFPGVKYITPLGYTKYMRSLGINKLGKGRGPNRIYELDWWDSIEFPGIKFEALPTQHWCGRGLKDVNQMLWAAFAITTRPGRANSKRIYFAGDTGFGPHFEEIAKKFRYFDLSLIPLGAYCPMHKEGGGHINPYEAVKVHQILKSKHSMGIHFDTFSLAQEPYGEAAKILKASLNYYGVPEVDFVAPDSAEFVEINGQGAFQFHTNS